MVCHEIKVDNTTNRLYAATGRSIMALSLADGSTIAHYTTSSESDDAYFHSLLLADQYLVAICNENKQVCVFNKDDLSAVSMRSFPKKPVSLDHMDGTLIVGDKFGDVYAAPLASTEPVVTEQSQIEPILGHVSMLTDVRLRSFNNHKYVLSADRDEHIRVSRFPQAYVIERFLFGHDEFVSRFEFIPNSNLLISGGGDDYIALYDWTTGECLDKVDIRAAITPYLDSELHKSIRDPESPKLDITVAQLLVIDATTVVVLCEATSTLLLITISNDNKLTLDKTAEPASSKIISIDYNSSSSQIVAALDNNELGLATYTRSLDPVTGSDSETDQDQNQTTFSSSVMSNFTPPLYTLKVLRKRGEF